MEHTIRNVIIINLALAKWTIPSKMLKTCFQPHELAISHSFNTLQLHFCHKPEQLLITLSPTIYLVGSIVVLFVVVFLCADQITIEPFAISSQCL